MDEVTRERTLVTARSLTGSRCPMCGQDLPRDERDRQRALREEREELRAALELVEAELEGEAI